MKTVCENCGKVVDSIEAIQTLAYGELRKYYAMRFCSVQCLAEFFKKELEQRNRIS
mgnify:CR=1 FL=1